jgi:hypothetical protein
MTGSSLSAPLLTSASTAFALLPRDTLTLTQIAKDHTLDHVPFRDPILTVLQLLAAEDPRPPSMSLSALSPTAYLTAPKLLASRGTLDEGP